MTARCHEFRDVASWRYPRRYTKQRQSVYYTPRKRTPERSQP